MSENSEQLRQRILRMFREWRMETLDLHELFEAGDSNDPDARRMVFYMVENLVAEGLLEERGNDFYALSPAGKKAIGEGGGTKRKRGL